MQKGIKTNSKFKFQKKKIFLKILDNFFLMIFENWLKHVVSSIRPCCFLFTDKILNKTLHSGRDISCTFPKIPFVPKSPLRPWRIPLPGVRADKHILQFSCLLTSYSGPGGGIGFCLGIWIAPVITFPTLPHLPGFLLWGGSTVVTSWKKVTKKCPFFRL